VDVSPGVPSKPGSGLLGWNTGNVSREGMNPVRHGGTQCQSPGNPLPGKGGSFRLCQVPQKYSRLERVKKFDSCIPCRCAPRQKSPEPR